MKCKYCGAELKPNPNHPNWLDCDNCKTYWKVLGMDFKNGTVTMQPFKEFEICEKSEELWTPLKGLWIRYNG